MRYSHMALEQRSRPWDTWRDRLGSPGMVQAMQVRSLDSNPGSNYHGVFHRAFFSFRTLCPGQCCYSSVCPLYDGALRGFHDLSFIEHQTNEIISASRRRRTTTSQKAGLAPAHSNPCPLPLKREKNVFQTHYEGIYQPSTGMTAFFKGL